MTSSCQVFPPGFYAKHILVIRSRQVGISHTLGTGLSPEIKVKNDL